MLERGVYLAPSQFEAAFVSLAHTDADLDARRARRGRRETLANSPEPLLDELTRLTCW